MTGILGTDLIGSFLLAAAPTVSAAPIAVFAILGDEMDGGDQ